MHNDTGRIYCRGHNRRYFVVDDVVSIAVFFFFWSCEFTQAFGVHIWCYLDSLIRRKSSHKALTMLFKKK